MKAWRLRGLIGLLLLCLWPAPPARAQEPSLGERIRSIFATPTPTPVPRRRKAPRRKSSPTPTPKPKSSPTPYAKKARSKASPSPSGEKTPRPKGKKSSPSPSPSPSASPSPSPEESPTPSPSPSPSPSASASPTPEARVTALSPDEIKDFAENPEPVRQLISAALELTKRNLDYQYGSADPESGGMDCSGFIYFVLRQAGLDDVPRDASGQYVWVRKSGNFRAVLSRELDSFELDELAPGDLLFWTGTYSIERDPPVTHTMIYLGKEKDSGKPIMVGASDGRTYEGEKQSGVSVFDFKVATGKSSNGRQPRFVGYGKIPGLR